MDFPEMLARLHAESLEQERTIASVRAKMRAGYGVAEMTAPERDVYYAALRASLPSRQPKPDRGPIVLANVVIVGLTIALVVLGYYIMGTSF